MDKPTAVVSSSLLALQAAAVAMAADTPQTDMSALIVMLRVLEPILSTFWPNQNVVINTTGVTIQATKIPGRPIASILPNNTSAPSMMSPVLM